VLKYSKSILILTGIFFQYFYNTLVRNIWLCIQCLLTDVVLSACHDDCPSASRRALVPGKLTVVLWFRDRSLFGPWFGLDPNPDRLIEQ
jgi:hypothetical protein